MTRGEALNNPGDLEHEAGQVWEGQSPDQPDPTFVKFTNAAYGLRAIAKTLATYQAKGITTIAGAITRYAPPSKNDTGAYIADVCEHCQASPGSPFARSLLPFIRGLITHEQGRCVYTDDQINAAIAAAKGTSMALVSTTTPKVAVSTTTAVAGAGGIAYAITTLIVGAFYDIWHINITADRQMALALVIGAVLHHFFSKGEPT